MVIVAGEVKLRRGSLARLKPAMEIMLRASRAEPGCLAYTYALDVLDDTVIRVFEMWHSESHLNAHFETAHLKTWRAALAEANIVSRDLTMYDTGEAKPV